MIYILYIFLAFLVLGILSIVVSYLVNRNIDIKEKIQNESQKGMRTLSHENNSKNIEMVMFNVKNILKESNLELKAENILEKTYKGE